MKELLTRSISGLAYAIIMVTAIYFSSLSFIALFLILLVIGMIEFYDLTSSIRTKPQKLLGILIGVVFFIFNTLYAINYIDIKLFLLLIPLIVLLFISELYRFKKRPISNVAYTLLGVLYIAVPLSLLNYLVFSSSIDMQKTQIENIEQSSDMLNNLVDYFYFLGTTPIKITYNPNLMLGYLFLVWTYDTCAYFVGSLIGRHKLSERVSPKKTWEGVFGGAVITFVVAYLISRLYSDIMLNEWVFITIIIVLIGTYGDLVESLFKRSINVKDSGNIMPGHGGMLDRFDSFLLSAPVIFMYFQLLR